MRRILFVDDEQAILRSLYRLFRERDYEINLAESGKEALEFLEQHEVDLVVSDMRMPSMSGHQLLLKVKEKYPDTMRLILSGYAQEQELFRSLLDGSSKMYLLKPWDNEMLLQIVDHIFKLQGLLRERRLLDRIESMDNLPTLPGIYRQLCTMLEEEADIKQIAGLINRDQAIAAKVLQLANSAFCSVKTGSAQQAVSFLGLSIVKNIVMASSIFDEKNGGKVQTSIREILWRHSSIANRLLLTMSEELLHKKMPDDRASAGLLHDIGKVLLAKQFGARFAEVMLQSEQLGMPSLEELEREAFGVSHQELGAYLLNWWQLPYPIVEAALFSHDPLNAPLVHRELVCLTHLANYYSWKKVRPSSKAKLEEGVFAVLGIAKEDCEILLKQLKDG